MSFGLLLVIGGLGDFIGGLEDLGLGDSILSTTDLIPASFPGDPIKVASMSIVVRSAMPRSELINVPPLMIIDDAYSLRESRARKRSVK